MVLVDLPEHLDLLLALALIWTSSNKPDIEGTLGILALDFKVFQIRVSI